MAAERDRFRGWRAWILALGSVALGMTLGDLIPPAYEPAVDLIGRALVVLLVALLLVSGVRLVWQRRAEIF